MDLSLETINVETEQEALLLIRRRCNLNQFQFAEELGISKSMLRLIEKDGGKISDKTKEKVQLFLETKYHLFAEGMK